MTPDFELASKTATRLLIKQNLSSLFIDVREFRLNKITIDTIQHYSEIVGKQVSDFICNEISGCFLLKLNNDINIILYNDNEKNKERKHWGIAHELGHIYLNHDIDNDIAEIEANFFAAQLIMPEVVLRELARRRKCIDESFLTNNFNVSLESARKRVATLKRRQSFIPTPLDNMLLHKVAGLLDCNTNKLRSIM